MDTSPSHVCSLALHCPDPASTTQMLPLAQVSRIPLQLSSKVPSHIAVRRRRRGRDSVVGEAVGAELSSPKPDPSNTSKETTSRFSSATKLAPSEIFPPAGGRMRAGSIQAREA
eukprot:1178761-Prorocentrum_minimum.AAC.2